MDEQNKKPSKWLIMYLSIYHLFMFVSSFIVIAKFIDKIKFLSGLPCTILTYVLFMVHIVSSIFILVYGKEELLKNENEKKKNISNPFYWTLVFLLYNRGDYIEL